MYHDMCLRFSDAAEALRVLYAADQPLYRNIDIIGIVYAPTGVMLSDGENEYPETAPVPGWHVNVRLLVGTEDPAPLMAYQVLPATPMRVWA